MKNVLSVKRGIYFLITFVLSLSLLLGSGCIPEKDSPDDEDRTLIDDWKTQSQREESYATTRPATTSPMPTVTPTMAPTAMPEPTVAVPEMVVGGSSAYEPSDKGNIGLAVGGAKDINNFRENIENGYLPLPTDVTYEGLFYDYYFDTGQQEACDSLFCPSYSYAVTRDPFSGETEYYLSVGLNSGMKESDFQRKKLNLVVVLDISGSMDSPFDRYYYDRFGNRQAIESEDAGRLKIELATESVVSLLDHLNDDDRFGMVLFNNTAYLAKPLNLVGVTDMDAIREHILDITAHGGTNLDAGMQVGTDLFNELTNVDPSVYENRIIFLTDAMPNLGDTSRYGLLGITSGNSEQRIFTTFIGIGVDFNTELVEYITKIKGANYYSVHSAQQFRERMDDEFEFMVTPLVFDLRLTLEADGWEIEEVYGSPEANEATGELMKVNTLFPSKQQEGETKGGLVLLKMHRIGWASGSLTLRASYEDRNGRQDSSTTEVILDAESAEFFDNSGIRKGILLARYAALLKNWMIDEREHAHLSQPWDPRVDDWAGIDEPPVQPQPSLGEWERQSLSLMVSGPYRELFDAFRLYFYAEMNAIGDDTLQRELDILDTLAEFG